MPLIFCKCRCLENDRCQDHQNQQEKPSGHDIGDHSLNRQYAYSYAFKQSCNNMHVFTLRAVCLSIHFATE